MCFFFKHFQQVCRANIEKVLSIRGSVFIPFNEGSVTAFRVVLESVIELDSMSLAGPFQPRAFCDSLPGVAVRAGNKVLGQDMSISHGSLVLTCFCKPVLGLALTDVQHCPPCLEEGVCAPQSSCSNELF